MTASKKAALATCSVGGCDMLANRVGAGLCEKHYMRLRRRGTTERACTIKPGKLKHTGGYVLVYTPHHPLRRESSPRVYEHRVVFYDAHGNGPFSCNWCGCVVTWDDMHVDHVNAVVTDNRLSNLVASCATCNQERGRAKMTRTKRSKKEWQHAAHGRTMCLSEWSRYLGISRASLLWRMRAGWPVAEVFTPRRGKSGPASKQYARKQFEQSVGAADKKLSARG